MPCQLSPSTGGALLPSRGALTTYAPKLSPQKIYFLPSGGAPAPIASPGYTHA